MSTNLLHRALIRLSALAEEESVRSFLQGLVTNDVSGALPVYAGLLSAQGKTLFDFIVWADGADLLLDCEAEVVDELVRRLSLYRLRRRIGIERDRALSVQWSKDPVDGAVADPRLVDLGWRWIAPVESQQAGADSDWLNHRLSLGVPEGRAELGDVLWLETNAAELNGVSFTKGCYVGQENTARMNWRQKVNRRLVVVPLSLSDEQRRKAAYPELGLAVDHRKVEDMAALTLPRWQAAALAVPTS
ncbi:folate-binding protein YgfZ [Porphyrobacter sp. GA68]|uniref:CAF17-like 4Fe-4S cluster assembly/insertion protein YgfZ n=1 Tax=Porphyrobacter sp. GA68 TaxID=2883480 RepID=UPI001D1884E0|nr:folate-binding protein [Porphyrobacter sp. GA68]